MASGKVARRTVVADVTAILDSPEIAALIDNLDGIGSPRGRKGYGPKALVGACLIKSLYALPTWTFVAALIAEHPGLQNALGGCPSVWAMYRFGTKLRENRPVLEAALDSIADSLREQYPELGKDLAIDATDMPAFANGHRYTHQGGELRERYSDPDASWGHRSAVSVRGAGGFYGYKLDLAVCARTGLPLAWSVRTARNNESLFATPLLDKVRSLGIQPETCAMDKGYDVSRLYADCEERGINPVIPLKGMKGKQPVLPIIPTGGRLFPHIPRDTDRFRVLYRGRSAAERAFADLKTSYGLAPLRVRGLERVRLHADLAILSRLSLALLRSSEAQIAA